jgi:putative ABC transport system permease protein
MNLAIRDARHNAGRFVLTSIGLGLLLGIVVTMMGIYRGQLDDSIRVARAANPDLWVVQAETLGPFAEGSRVPGDTREMVARVHGVEAAGSVTYQTIQAVAGDRKLRLFVVGYELGRPGGPSRIVEGRSLSRSHYEMVADGQTGLRPGEVVPLGRHLFTVVGLTRDQVTQSGDPVVYITLQDAQKLQFDLAPAMERRDEARGAPRAGTDIINAVVAQVEAGTTAESVAQSIRRWKHLTALTAPEQETILSKTVIEKISRQLGMFLVLLIIVSTVIIALIIYTLTMDKLRSIATLKLIGAPDRTIIGLIVQQSLVLGVSGFVLGTLLVALGKDHFPRRVVMQPEDVAVLFGIVLVVCLVASALGVRLAIKVDPAKALTG